jgi:hypothetical protein
MSENQSRRDFFHLAAAGAGAAALMATAGAAQAEQGNMVRALEALQAALDSLRNATPNKGGHRENAMGLIEQAIEQVQAGIDFAARHGGG